MISAIQSLGLVIALIREVGVLTDAVVRALGRRYSSTGWGDWFGGGGVRSA